MTTLVDIIQPRPYIQNSKHFFNNTKNFTNNLIQSKQLNIKDKSSDILMPEILESIDEFPDEVENINVAVEEKIEKPNPNSNLKTSTLTRDKNYNINIKPLTIFKKYFNNENIKTNRTNKITPISTKIFIQNTTNYPIFKKITTTIKTAKTTKKNFRKFNDYYSMYYDV